jgi:ribosomal-protein-alanine N-acetyltransferase
MSAIPTPPPLRLLPIRRMQPENLREVVAIEKAVYPFPWTLGNFNDSLKSAYQAWILRDESETLAGYFLLMPAFDEAHLLNITVRGDLQGHGLGRLMLDHVVAIARRIRMESILLEVRPSNVRALKIYEQYGFIRIGLRKDYYPAPDNTREDALVMRLVL